MFTVLWLFSIGFSKPSKRQDNLLVSVCLCIFPFSAAVVNQWIIHFLALNEESQFVGLSKKKKKPFEEQFWVFFDS